MEIPQFPKAADDARVALVTGGGRGIGRACALRLAAAGYRVAVTARSIDEIDEVAGIIHEGGGSSLSDVCDVTQPESVQRVFSTCEKRWGGVHVVVNNAGNAQSVPFAKMSREQWLEMIDVNLHGTFNVTHQALPAMLKAGWGRIINVASTAGLAGFRYVAHYVAAKHAVVGLTRALALEVAGKGVTVNAVCPGWVETDLLAQTLKNISEKTGRTIDEARDTLKADIPTHRFVLPERVAELVAFLASDSAMDVTGATMTMDGGETAGH
jgi:3-hydroxybutyrate dehydrogenase